MLTQNQIKKITKLSVGAISQALKVLNRRNLVEISPLERNKNGKQLPRIYRIRPLSLAGINRIHSLFGTIIEWKPIFQEMKANLEKNVKVLEKLKGYAEITEFIDNLLSITPKYENIINFFEN
jgi:DNA-binding transcriptional ArsR family regulator